MAEYLIRQGDMAWIFQSKPLVARMKIMAYVLKKRFRAKKDHIIIDRFH